MDTTPDQELLTRAGRGDRGALDALLACHLHPAWRMALVTAPDEAAARRATVSGVVDALAAAQGDDRRGPAAPALRVRVVGAVRCAAVLGTESLVDGGRPRVPSGPARTGDVALDAFRALPERARAALWLVDVEGGTPGQAAPILGVDAGPAGTLVARSRDAFRARLAADAATRESSPECVRSLGHLPALVTGTLDDYERARLRAHLDVCAACERTAAIAAQPREVLRRLVTPVPAVVEDLIAERWAGVAGEPRRQFVAPRVPERLVGAMAATVLFLGIGSMVATGGDQRTAVQLAGPIGATGSPTAPSDAPEPAVVPVAATTPPPLPTAAPPAPGGGGGGSDDGSGSGRSGSSGAGTGRTTGTAPGAARPVAPPAGPTASTPTTPAPAPTPPAGEPTTPPAAPPVSEAPTPPASPVPTVPTIPLPVPGAENLQLDLGVAQVELGSCLDVGVLGINLVPGC